MFNDTMKQSNDMLWKVSLALLCLGLSVYRIFYSTHDSNDLAYLFGSSLPISLLLWIVYNFLVGRKYGARIKLFSLITIHFCMVASGYIGYSQQVQEFKHALLELKKQNSAYYSPITSLEGIHKLATKPYDINLKVRGDLGEVLTLMVKTKKAISDKSVECVNKLESIGVSKLLEPQRIKNDIDLAESRKIIQESKKTIDNYHAETTITILSFSTELNSLDLNESLTQSVQSAFNLIFLATILQLEQIWALEHKAFSELESNISLLSDTDVEWEVKDNQIIFLKDSDLIKYKSYIKSIEALVNQQQQISNQNIEKYNSEINHLIKLLDDKV